MHGRGGRGGRGGRVFSVLSVLLLAACSEDPPAEGTVIHNVLIYDGSGGLPYLGGVRIVEDRIVEVGDVEMGPSDWIVSGEGLALAPGFIDTHSHADRALDRHPDALAAVSQGVTTVITGQDGSSPWPLAGFLSAIDSSPAAVNVASYAGHNTIRRLVLGDDFRREATHVEVDSMRQLLYTALDAGALGLSTGLEYDPGIYAGWEELLLLARVTSAEGGRYITHIRSEDRTFMPALEEAIRLGHEAGVPVQISHLKLAMRGLWGSADSVIRRLDQAREEGVEITADMYPYTYWQSSLTVLFPERNFSDRAEAEYVLGEIVPPGGLRVSRFAPDTALVGLTLAEVARRRGREPAATLLALIAEAQAWEERTGENAESVIAASMQLEDILALLSWPWVSIGSDGALDGAHPRGFGAFARVLAWSRERTPFPMEEAIRRMTSLAARSMGLLDRGVIRAGGFADLVMFDPDSVADHATLDEPHRTATGIRMVWVNGQVVYDEGKPTGRRPGRVIRRGLEG